MPKPTSTRQVILHKGSYISNPGEEGISSVAVVTLPLLLPCSPPPAGPPPCCHGNHLTSVLLLPALHPPCSPRPDRTPTHPPAAFSYGHTPPAALCTWKFNQRDIGKASVSESEEVVEVLLVLFGQIHAGICYRGKSCGQYNVCMPFSVVRGPRLIL